MRLLIGYLIVVAIMLAAQSMHPRCSMSDMVGAEWLQCLTR